VPEQAGGLEGVVRRHDRSVNPGRRVCR
jgi:hypothetical protein